jgi:hypothetical protein
MALSLPEAVEASHMDHPDFRVRGKIFATLGYPDEDWGMVSLSPTDQQLLVLAEPGVFVPANGAWGRRGATTVLLRAAKKNTVRDALAAAWRKTAPKTLAQTNVDARQPGERPKVCKPGRDKR